MPKKIRAKKLVDKQVQGQLMGKMVMYFLVYNGALMLITVGAWYMEHASAQLTGQPTANLTEEFARFTAQHKPMAYGMIILLPLILWDMLKTSHRFAGPIYRFRRTLEDHIAGKPLERVKLRDGDYLGEFEAVFNRFVEKQSDLASDDTLPPVQSPEAELTSV